MTLFKHEKRWPWWCNWPMWKNVKGKRRPDGPWPDIPSCSICQLNPNHQLQYYTVQNVQLLEWQSNIPPSNLPLWNGRITALPSNRCGASFSGQATPRQMIGERVLSAAVGTAFDSQSGNPNAHWWMIIRGTNATGEATRIVWQGWQQNRDRFTGGGVYQRGTGPGNHDGPLPETVTLREAFIIL